MNAGEMEGLVFAGSWFGALALLCLFKWFWGKLTAPDRHSGSWPSRVAVRTKNTRRKEE